MTKRVPPFRPTRKHVRLIDIRGKKVTGSIVNRVSLRQRSSRIPKYFVLEETQFPTWHGTARTQLRFGYWIIGKKPRMRNKWTWGQFAPLIPKVDLLKLIRKARKKGIL